MAVKLIYIFLLQIFSFAYLCHYVYFYPFYRTSSWTLMNWSGEVGCDLIFKYDLHTVTENEGSLGLF